MLRLVHAVHDAGVPAKDIRTAITGPCFLAVDGILTGEDLRAAFIAAYPKSAKRLRRWFFDDPIHDNDKTWVLSNQWGGENAARTLDALVALAPPSSGIDYEPA